MRDSIQHNDWGDKALVVAFLLTLFTGASVAATRYAERGDSSSHRGIGGSFARISLQVPQRL